MRNTCSIKENRIFKTLYYHGVSHVNKHLVIYTLRNRLGSNRLGITVSKKVGNAVVRNRVRRLIKESYRLSEASVRLGFDIVFVARRRAVGCGLDEISRSMYDLIGRSRLRKN